MADIDSDAMAKYLYMHSQDEKKQDQLTYQLDASEILDTMGKEWQGLEETERGEYVNSPYKMRMLNKKGATAVMSFVKPLITRIVSLSLYQEGKIDINTKHFADNLTSFLARHMHDFEMTSFPTMRMIIYDCTQLVYSTYKKAESGGERDTLRKNFHLSENKELINREKQSMLGFSNPFKEK